MHLVGFITRILSILSFSSVSRAHQKLNLVLIRFQKNAMCLSVHRCIRVEKKNQLDATEWFIALIICSTCLNSFYGHHQELETICVLLPPMVCDALVAGCRRSGSGQQAMLLEQHPSSRTHSLLPCT